MLDNTPNFYLPPLAGIVYTFPIVSYFRPGCGARGDKLFQGVIRWKALTVGLGGLGVFYFFV